MEPVIVIVLVVVLVLVRLPFSARLIEPRTLFAEGDIVSLWRALRAGTRSLFRRREVEQELEDELRHYLELATAEHKRAGLSSAEAARAARLQVGGIEVTTSRVRSAGWEAIVETTWHDLRCALRGLRRNPGFTVLAIATLALGIGANTAMFSVVNAVLLRPLPYAAPNRLALIFTDDARRSLHQEKTAYLTITDWQRETRTFSDIAYFNTGRVALHTQGERIRTLGASASGNLFAVLGVAPLHGRVISEVDEAQNARVAVISHGLWQREFAGAPDIIGRTVTIDDGGKNGPSALTVIGVMPPEFYFPSRNIGIWTPSTNYWRFSTESTERFQDWARRWTAIGRLTPEASIADARADLARIGAQLSATNSTAVPDFPGFSTTVMPVLDSVAGTSLQSALWLLLGAVGLVLLVACVNVAHLQLARGASRQQEFAVRRALGAGRARLVRQLTAESILLALAGGAAGIMIATWGTRVLSRTASTYLPRIDEIGLDGRVLLFTVVVSLAAGLIFGVVPSLRLSGVSANEVLREGGHGTGSVRLRRTRGMLVVAECSLAIVLLTGAGLLLKSLQRVQSVDPGFQPRNALTIRLEFPAEAAPAVRPQEPVDPQVSARVREQHMEELTARLEAIPGVEAAGFIDDLFVSGAGNESITIPGRTDQTTGELQGASASPGFFAALAVPLKRGRYLTRADAAQKIHATWNLVQGVSLAEKERRAIPEPVVVNEAFVRRYFPNEDPIGKKFCIDPLVKTYWFQIVGVIADMHRQGLERAAIPQYIGPYITSSGGRADLIVRVSGDPLAHAPTIRPVVQRQMPGVVVATIATAEAQLGEFSAQRRLQTGLLTTFAALALVLATVGIFGLVHYAVSERTREIGLRVALGASPRDVLGLVIGQGMRMPVLGVAIGLAAAAGLTRVMAHLLFGVGATDPLTFVTVAAVLSLIAITACYAAARRAVRLDPLHALRES